MEDWKLKIAAADTTVGAQLLSCTTACFRAPQYYLSRVGGLPTGVVTLAGGLNATISTTNATQMRLALTGGASAQAHFN